MVCAGSESETPIPESKALLLPAVLLCVGVFALYATTAAPGTLFGDPSEYQFIPAIGGIAHPPGYAFYTLLARLWQTVVPIGTIAFRTNLLATAAGTWVVTLVYLVVRDLGQGGSGPGWSHTYSAAFAALSLAVSSDFWQHSIHANAHIVSTACAATHLWLLVRWWRTGRDRWLVSFAVVLGLAATQHPVTLIGVPAYGVFIVAANPRILRRWRAVLALAGACLLGLGPLLYYPLRSPNAPFGPANMNTWEGFWGHITARGLRVNLFHFGLVDQLDRATVFWSLLRNQYALPVIILVFLGLVWLVRRAPKPALLLISFLVVHLAFTMNTVQDVMAYLLLPFTALSMVAGAGALAVSEGLARALYRDHRLPSLALRSLCTTHPPAVNVSTVVVSCLVLSLLFPWPVYQGVLNLRRGISMRDFTASEEWVEAVHDRFGGTGEGAVLLFDWEHLTPLWVHAFTQGRQLAEVDAKLVYVSTARSWVENVWAHIDEGPIYLDSYRAAVKDEGFRLVPEEPFYRVVAPPLTEIDPQHSLDVWAGDSVHLLGYDLHTPRVRAGQPIVLTLYQSVSEPLDGIWMPYAQLGPVVGRWTTDSRLLTTQWLPGEVVTERYELPVPFNLQGGAHRLSLGYADLSGSRPELPFSSGETSVDLGTVIVEPSLDPPRRSVLERAVANLGNQVALMKARLRVGLEMRDGPWSEPLVVHGGDVLHLTLNWRALASPRQSDTVFIHLMDSAGSYVSGHDYTPLGGACPSYLWFPKWLPDQTFIDPYRFALPDELPPGDYFLETGMYGMTSIRRVPVVDLAGNLAGDRVVLGPVRVE